MQLYQPKNELGRGLLNEGMLVTSSKNIIKSLSGGSLVLTDTDVSGDIEDWSVKSVICTIGGQEMSFAPAVAYRTGAIEIRVSRDGETIEGLSSVRVVLGRTIVSGIGSEEEVSIDVLIASGDIAKIDAYVDKVIAGGDDGEIRTVAETLANSGIRKYALSACWDYTDVQKKMISTDPPIGTKLMSGLTYGVVDSDFSYDLTYLYKGGDYGKIKGLFYNPTPLASQNLIYFSAKCPTMLAGCYMFSGCVTLVSFTSDLPKLTDGYGMFNKCASMTTFTGKLPSLEYGEYMFQGCTKLTTFNPWGTEESGESGSLESGYQMFHNCKLDLASVKRIADWLPQRADAKPTGGESSSLDGGWIHIGVAEGVNSGDEFNNAISKMTSKNWSVVICVNGAHTDK